MAEHVLAPARHAAAGRIGLRVIPGGLATPAFPAGESQRSLAVVGDHLVVTDNGDERRARLTTLREAAEVAGIEPGASPEVYPPVTPLDLDAELRIDPDAAGVLAEWFALVDESLRTLRDDLADRDPSEIQLWPEHFDEAFTVADVNFGGSPGDDGHEQPYLYVGPPTRQSGPFWNEPFGASAPWLAVESLDDALEFFRMGLARL